MHVEAKPSIQAHVLVGDPDQGKAADQVSAPVVEEKFVARNKKKKNGHVVAEAVFAGKNREQFAAQQMRAGLALSFAVCPRLAQDVFMSDGPGDASNGQGQQEQPNNLNSEGHSTREVF